MGKFNVNEHCLVRNQPCGRIFSGSKLCFIACPASEEISLELGIIKEILRKYGIEPYIAVEQRELGKDIFCEKICGKIIEAKFCIVILNDTCNDKCISLPSSNVYYEYGLMTGLHKELIPIQKSGQKLAFNIQSFDSIIYKPSNLSSIIEEAIIKNLSKVDSNNDTKPPYINPSWIASLKGYMELDKYENRDMRDVVTQFKDTSMLPFINIADNSLAIIGPYKSLDTDLLILQLKVLHSRFKQLYELCLMQINDLKLIIENGQTNARIEERYFNDITTIEKKAESLLNVKFVIVDTPDIDVIKIQNEINALIPEIEIWDSRI